MQTRALFDTNFWGTNYMTKETEVSSGGEPPRGRPSWARKMAHYSASKFGMSLFWTLSNATGTDDSDVLEAVEALSEALAAEIDPAWNIKVSRI